VDVFSGVCLLSHHIQLYGSMVGILSLLLFVCLFVCTVTDFSAAEKDIGVKHRMLVRLLRSGISFPHFGELWPGGAVWRDLRLADALVCQFVCLFVCQHDNFRTIKRTTINLAVRCIIQKSRPSSNVKVKGQRSRSPGTKKTKTAESSPLTSKGAP